MLRTISSSLVLVLAILLIAGCVKPGCCRCWHDDGAGGYIDSGAVGVNTFGECRQRCDNLGAVGGEYWDHPCGLLGPDDLDAPVAVGQQGNIYETGFGSSPPETVPQVDVSLVDPNLSTAPQAATTASFSVVDGSPNTGFITIDTPLFLDSLAVNRSSITGSLDLYIEPRTGAYDFIQVTGMTVNLPSLTILGHVTGQNTIVLRPGSLASNGRLDNQTGEFELFVPLKLTNNLFSSADDFRPTVFVSGRLTYDPVDGAQISLTTVNQHQHGWRESSLLAPLLQNE